MEIFRHPKPCEQAQCQLSDTLRSIFAGAEVFTVSNAYVVFYEDREIWCTKTAIRNHVDTLEKIRDDKPQEDKIREWTRHGYIIALDFSSNSDGVVRHELF